MSASLDATWGPFTGYDDARRRVSAYVDRTCAPTVGAVWSANGGLYPLRPPTRQAGDLADVVILEWTPAPRPPPPLPSGFLAEVKAFLKRAAQAQAQASMAQAQADMAMGQALGTAFGRMLHQHRDDGVGVALDVLCIALSIALIPTGIGLFTTMAGVAALGGFALLGMDGAAYAVEMAGDDEQAEAIKRWTEPYRIVATVMTLPDLFKGGYTVVRELRDVAAALPRAERTASTAETLAARAANDRRADQYAQIAARAHLRAQIRREQIMASLTHEIAPRMAGIGSTSLMIREEIQNDQSLLHQVVSRMQIHATSLHR